MFQEKTATLFLVITSANEHRFSQFFHCEILQEIFYRSAVETSPHLSCVATLPCEIWKSNIFMFQKQSLLHLIFFSFCPLHGRRTVQIWTPSTTQRGAHTRACVQASQDHGRRRAAPACRGDMRPSGPGSDWQRDQWMAQVTDSVHALQPAEDILSIHSEHYCICSHTN